MTYCHYSDRPMEAVKSGRLQEAGQKPNGLWITDSSEDSWEHWCRSEGFRLNSLAHRIEVSFAEDARLLWLRSPSDLLQFTDQYMTQAPDGHDPDYWREFAIDWHRVADAWQGVMIFPYQWSLRLELAWYYGWDCASGCIWDAAAVASISHDRRMAA